MIFEGGLCLTLFFQTAAKNANHMPMPLKINGETIPEQAILIELQRLMRFYAEHMPREQIGKHMDILLAKARDQVVGAKLLLLEARRRGIEVADGEIEMRVQQMIEQCGGEDKFNALLRKQNLALATLRESIRTGRQIDIFVARIIEHVEPPTETQTQAYYDTHPEVFTTPDRAQVRHILMKPDAAIPEAHAATVKRLRELKAQQCAGADFAGLAAAHSECPSGKKAGGSLGWIARGVTLPEFDEVLFRLHIGEVSEVFQTKLGLHIVQKTAEEQGALTPFDEVKEKISDLLLHQHRGEAINRVVEELKKRAKIEDDDPLSQPAMDAALDSFLDAPSTS